jgi:hypothetical protein
MTRIQIYLLVSVLVSMGGCVPVKQELDPAMEIAERMPGLVQIHHEDFDRAFLRPRADLGHYAALLIDPVGIEYYERPGERTRLPRASTTETLATDVRNIFVEALSAEGGYRIVDETGPGVLGIRLSLVNIEVKDSSRMSPSGGAGGARVTSVGKISVQNEDAYDAAMTLVIEIRNCDTDLVLFWARDRRSAPLSLRGTDQTSLLNRGRNLARKWAETLREGLGGPPDPQRREDGVP